MQYLLIKIDEGRFLRQELDPKTFEAELKRTVGDSKLEQIRFMVGGQEYHYLVTTQKTGLRLKLLALQGITEVFSFETKLMTE